MSYYYLATPYSAYPGGVERAFELAVDQTAFLLNAGIDNVFSPIAHAHPIAIRHNLHGGYTKWQALDEAMIRSCIAVVVVMADTWQQSAGIAREIEFARGLDKTIIYMVPDCVPLTLTARPGGAA